jgi:hypothetical protein
MFIINSCVDKCCDTNCCNNYIEEYFKSNHFVIDHMFNDNDKVLINQVMSNACVQIQNTIIRLLNLISVYLILITVTNKMI